MNGVQGRDEKRSEKVEMAEEAKERGKEQPEVDILQFARDQESFKNIPTVN